VDNGDLLVRAIQILTLLALMIGIVSTLGVLWTRRDYLFRPRRKKVGDLQFEAAAELMNKVILDFTNLNTHGGIDNQIDLVSMLDRLKRHATRPFLSPGLRLELGVLRRLVESKRDTAIQSSPLGESGWPENAVRWGRDDIPIVDQYLVLLDKTADQLQVDPSSFRDIREHLLGVKQELNAVVLPGS